MKELLLKYDREMRRNPPAARGERVERSPEVTRVCSDALGEASIVFSHLDDEGARDAIERELALARARSLSLEWKLYGHDEPADLGHRLEAYGFQACECESLMVVDTFAWQPAPLPAGAEVREVCREEDLGDLLAVKATQGEVSRLKELLGRALREEPQHWLIFVAYLDSVPVSAAWMRTYAGRDFADLWAGVTLPAHRGRGMYRALVSRRVEEARKRGIRFAAVDAMATSRPILQRLGFTRLTTSTPFLAPSQA